MAEVKSGKILVTHPGKLGDLVYSLSAIRAISKHFSSPVSIQISHYCGAIEKLLLVQDYIDQVYIDHNYKVKHEHRGFQPHTLEPIEGFEKVFELGYREEDDYDLINNHLRGYGFFALKEFYGLVLDELDGPSLTLPFDMGSSDKFVFQGFGETLDMVLGPDRVNNIMIHWAAVLRSTGKNYLVVTGPREALRYKALGFETLVSYDLLETAMILTQAKGVIASQSIVAALANELQTHRLVLGVFQNAVPTGRNGALIPFLDDSVSNAEFLVKWTM